MKSLGLKMSVSGVKELHKALEELGKKATQKAVLERSIKKAATPMLKRAKELAPVEDGDLVKSLVIQREVLSDPGKSAYAAAMRGGATKDQAVAARRTAQREHGGQVTQMVLGPQLGLRKGSHAHLVEFGTEHAAPQPFLRPAFDAEASKTVDRIGAILSDEIQKTAKRVAKRTAKRNGWEV